MELTGQEKDPKAKKARVVEQMIEMGTTAGLSEEELGSVRHALLADKRKLDLKLPPKYQTKEKEMSSVPWRRP